MGNSIYISGTQNDGDEVVAVMVAGRIRMKVHRYTHTHIHTYTHTYFVQNATHYCQHKHRLCLVDDMMHRREKKKSHGCCAPPTKHFPDRIENELGRFRDRARGPGKLTACQMVERERQ